MEEETDMTSRVAITAEQMEGLLEFIEQNPALAKGKTKPLNLSQQLWTQCAKKLNACKNGAKKNDKQWAKSWTDMKYRVRRRALELQAAKAEGKPLPEDLLPLSQTEERILSVIGKEAIEDVVIKCDQSAWSTDVFQDTNVIRDVDCSTSTKGLPPRSLRSGNKGHVEDDPSPSQATRRTKRQARKRRLSQHESSDDQYGPTERKPKLNNNEDAEIDSDSDHNASAFLEMERQKIDNAERLTDAVCDIRNQMSRLIEVLVNIKDIFVNTRNTHM